MQNLSLSQHFTYCRQVRLDFASTEALFENHQCLSHVLVLVYQEGRINTGANPEPNKLHAYVDRREQNTIAYNASKHLRLLVGRRSNRRANSRRFNKVLALLRH